ncbi:MAG: glycosyltransferase [Mucilaginibacter sp.]|uniref:XrtY-associated glycosyltransferase XYAG1 n=1 Tax=Mucilaginibacter sp. TaxID=1882438 RepID=UPI003267CF1E
MKILFIVPYYKPAYIYGGPIVVISLLAENLVTLGHDVTVYSSKANGKSELDIGDKEILVDGVKVLYFSRLTKGNTYVAPGLWKLLTKTVRDFDVVHIHSWWNFLALGAALICKRQNIKPVLSPHGMLADYVFYNRHAFAKKWIHKLIGENLLRNSWLHVSTQMEWDESKNIIPEWSGEIIPNLIKLSDHTYHRPENEVFSIGFLSRIDPKKGLDVLIKALSRVTLPYKLFVAGEGEGNYISSLKKLSVKCGNDDKITWIGWKSGEGKFDFLAQMDLFALTSHSENFAIVVVEALSVGTPVLVSNYVGLSTYVEQMGYGMVTDMDPINIAAQITDLITDQDKIKKINHEAPGVIKREYEETSLARRYLQFYNSTKTL